MGRAIKLTYSFVKTKFEEENYVLLSEKYINAITPLQLICPNGHVVFIKWREFKDGCRCRTCSYIKRGIKQQGSNNSSWKGGVRKSNLPLFASYKDKLSPFCKVYPIKQDNLELLGVECIYCGKVFIPNVVMVRAKIATIKGKRAGESNFYCSAGCKQACPTFKQIKYPKGIKPATSREVQPELRKLVLVRDNYRCQICDADINTAELHCHHIEAVSQNPVESLDIDNCIILCKKHHKQVHTLPGCNYNELKCNKFIYRRQDNVN